MTRATGELLDAADEPQTAIATTTPDVTSMFERLARDPSVDVEKLERLISMQERILAHQARSAFNAAFAELQGEIPAIVERGKTNLGTYARLEDIIEGIRPILQRHGFALSHRTEWPDAKTVKVIGVLTHKGGHERTSEFLSSADTTGSKNAIQGLGSAVAYGRRYTTKDLLTIVTTDEDDDGAATSKPEPDLPAGFDDWADDMTATASEGTDALKAAWSAAKPQYRRAAGQVRLDAWKKVAARADAARKAGDHAA